MQVRQVGERQGIPLRYLEQIFRRLRQAGLVSAKRGPGGGYTLVRSPEEISLLEVVEAVEGPIDEARAALPESEDGPPVHRPEFFWAEIAERFGKALESISIADLCGEATRRGLPCAADEGPMYHI